MKKKTKGLNFKFSFKETDWKKLSKKLLRFGMIASLITILVASWATQRQEEWNEQIFWDTNRITNAVGAFALIVGWGFWEFYLVSKKRKMWLQIGAIVALVAATVLINGLLGLIGGGLAIIFTAVSFALDYTKIITLRKDQG